MITKSCIMQTKVELVITLNTVDCIPQTFLIILFVLNLPLHSHLDINIKDYVE